MKWKGNVYVLQHLQSDRLSGSSNKLFLNVPIQFYLNNMINIHKLTSQSMTSCHNMEIIYWQ